VHRCDFVNAGGMGEDTTWATDLVRKLGKDKVIWCKTGSGVTGIDAFAMGLTTVFIHEGHNSAGKIDVLAGALDVVEDRSASVGKGSTRSRSCSIQGKVERKFEFTAHSGNAANRRCQQAKTHQETQVRRRS
jgi:hypothetical protein